MCMRLWVSVCVYVCVQISETDNNVDINVRKRVPPVILIFQVFSNNVAQMINVVYRTAEVDNIKPQSPSYAE